MKRSDFIRNSLLSLAFSMLPEILRPVDIGAAFGKTIIKPRVGDLAMVTGIKSPFLVTSITLNTARVRNITDPGLFAELLDVEKEIRDGRFIIFSRAIIGEHSFLTNHKQ